ncbi:MAG: hypothetical protein Q9160_007389 [Pyrenula sp. 1 TL-2023]
MNAVKALLFDVFGTASDWRGTVPQALQQSCTTTLNSSSASIPSTVRLSASSMTSERWAQFAQEWRASYHTFCRSYDPQSDFISVDEHHRQSLKELLEKWELGGLWDDDQILQMSLIWHFLKAWPDAPAGIGKLNTKYMTATLSNGNLSLLSDLVRTGPLPFQRIISAEEFKAYKPSPLVYRGGAKTLDLEPSDCALVAAHLGDLKAAKECGCKAFYVERPEEESWDKAEIQKARDDGWVDIWIPADKRGFLALAEALGIT